MTSPLRIQRKRTKGWRMPPNTVYCGRPSLWENRWRIGVFSSFFGRTIKTNTEAVRVYRALAWPTAQDKALVRENLHGKNLACWCRLCDEHKAGKPLDVKCEKCAPCHVDVLGDIANAEIGMGENKGSAA